MSSKNRLPLRVLGISMVLGGLGYLYLTLNSHGLIANLQAYPLSSWKLALVLIGLLILWACYLGRKDLPRKLKLILNAFGIPLLLAVATYFGTVAVSSLVVGASPREILLAFTAISSHDFGWANFLGVAFAVLVFLGAVGGAIAVFSDDTQTQETGIHQRGRQLVTFSEAQARARRLTSSTDRGIYWGMLNLPSEIASTHFAVVGATGSGKTIILRLLMQSVLPQIIPESNTRALIYDAKQDILSILAGMKLSCPVVTLNPFDSRSASWDMARDVTGPATAQQVASILIPENRGESQPFFSDAARHILTGVLVTFIKSAPESWSLRDVLLAIRTKTRLKQTLSSYPDNQNLLEYFSNESTAQNILSTLQSRMQRYEYIAAAWERASERVSLSDWLNGECILILGNDEATRTALDAINQVIFKRLSELILALPESANRRSWIFLDEVREAGELTGLGRLLTKGRSKGACVVLGFQDIDGLREVYGAELANEIVGLCANKAILRTDSPSTAKWASELFGEREILEVRQSLSETQGKNSQPGRLVASSTTGKSNSTQEQLTKRDVVLASEFMDMLPTNPKNGLSGYYLCPTIGAYSARVSWESIQAVLVPPDQSTPDLEPRPESAQYLPDWTEGDYARLKLRTSANTAADPNPDAVTAASPEQELNFLSQIRKI